MLSDAAVQVLRQTVRLDACLPSGPLVAVAQAIAADGETLTVAQAVALAVAARAMDGEKGAVDVLAKLAAETPPESDAEYGGPLCRTVVRVRVVDGNTISEKWTELPEDSGRESAAALSSDQATARAAADS